MRVSLTVTPIIVCPECQRSFVTDSGLRLVSVSVPKTHASTDSTARSNSHGPAKPSPWSRLTFGMSRCYAKETSVVAYFVYFVSPFASALINDV